MEIDLLGERPAASYVGKVVSVKTGAVLALRVWPADLGNMTRAKEWADETAKQKSQELGKCFRGEVEIEW